MVSSYRSIVSPKTLAKFGAAFALAAAILYGFIPESGYGEKNRILLTGSSTIAPLAAELARAYEKAHPGTRIDVETGGSSRGISDIRRGLADIGMVSRALKPTESDLVSHLVARDGVALIIHKTNPVDGLTSDQTSALYTRKIANWSALDGPDQKVVLVHKAQGRSTLEIFLKYFGLSDDDIRPDVVIGDNEQGIKTVAANPSAIGYVSIGTAETAIEHGASIKLLHLDGIAASTALVADGRFPMTRALNFVTKDTSSPKAADFIAFAQSDSADALIRSLAFVPPKR
ncbi:phosphate ABC transporter substrate-binding protein [Iodidimonas gelatinilytica]|uniref:Phosphate ABC transporter substrate-binding protein n=1 Tax=Iodidimonas gelatinilytica TaxID=1236966 RepID=A0A5A7MYM0_9PROT|nr:phosphate ABC transporter substrate-binding protein [Iodidimonas gelatinilytica]